MVISNKSGFCHGIVTGPETLHICYCLIECSVCKFEGFFSLSTPFIQKNRHVEMKADSYFVGRGKIAPCEGICFLIALRCFVKVFICIIYLAKVSIKVRPYLQVKHFSLHRLYLEFGRNDFILNKFNQVQTSVSELSLDSCPIFLNCRSHVSRITILAN